MNLSKDARRMLALIAGLTLVIIVCSAVFYRSSEFLPFAYGALLTCALNCVKVLLIERTVQKTVTMQSGGLAFGWGQYMLRFLLTGAVLVLAALSPYISLWGAVAGIFTFQVSAYMLKLFRAD